MESIQQRPRELPIVGGHLALDFANTVDDPLGPARHDHVASYPDLIGWAVRSCAIDSKTAATLLASAVDDPAAAAAALESAHRLRDVLNDIFGAVVDHETGALEHWTELRRFAASAVARSTLDGTDRKTLRWIRNGDTEDLALVLHPIALAATELLTSADLSRVKRCARCPWLFLDNSKNHSRRWCDMNDCGRAQKIERYVARRAARQQAVGRRNQPRGG
jgi:predicted RNA-binding Zn ribbon-like protein